MGNNGYEFDHISFTIRNAGSHIWHTLRSLLWFVLVTATATILLYVCFALFVSTDTERNLKKENKMLQKLCPILEEKAELISDGVTSLQQKDNEIYKYVFHTEAPSIDPMGSLEQFFGAANIPDAKLVSYTAAKATRLSNTAASVDVALTRALLALSAPDFTLPPMTLPVKDISYPQIGASKGQRINPFLKAGIEHDGLDIIASQGSKIYAPADGKVTEVTTSSKGSGNRIEISHAGGYTTRYEHLSDIYVRQGERVTAGRCIGTVGMSGAASAPHLHYEVRKDSVARDPANYIFAGLTPEEYCNMLFMAINTEQSMD